MLDLLVRLLVAIIVAAVVVWLLGDVAGLHRLIVGVGALLAFIATFAATDRLTLGRV